MTPAAITSLYTSYKRFTVSRFKTWKPKVEKDLRRMIANGLDEPTTQQAIKHLDTNMLKPSGLAITIMNIYKDAAVTWGGHIYQLVKKQADKMKAKRQQGNKASLGQPGQEMSSKAMMPIGYNEAMLQEVIGYMRLHNVQLVQEITGTMKEWLLKQLIEGQAQGLGLREIAGNIANDDFPAKRALVISRTETIKAANYGAVQGAKKTGFQSEKLWIAARDFRTRRTPRDEFNHFNMHGKTVEMDEAFHVPNRNGSIDNLMQPGDPQGDAADVIQCRCTVGFNVKRGADGLPVRA